MAKSGKGGVQKAMEAQRRGEALLRVLLSCDFVTPDVEKSALSLIAEGANVNVRGKNNVTPLLAACAKRSPRIVSALLDAGADMNARNIGGNAPILMVSAFGPVEILKMLLDRGARLDLKDEQGYTAYDWAYEKQGGAFTSLIEAEEKKRAAADKANAAQKKQSLEKAEEESRRARIEKIASKRKTGPSWRK